MIYSQPTQQDLRKVLANTTSINKFRKAFYKERTNGLPTFEDIYYIIEQVKYEGGHPFEKIEHDKKVSWELFKKDMQHFVSANKAFYKRLDLLKKCLKRLAPEAEVRAVLPMLKSESTQHAVKAASLMSRMNYYKSLVAVPLEDAKPALKKPRRNLLPHVSKSFQTIP